MEGNNTTLGNLRTLILLRTGILHSHKKCYNDTLGKGKSEVDK